MPARRFLADDYGAATFAESVGHALGVELSARDIKGATFEDAQEIAKSKSERQLSETIRQAIEENLPADAEKSEWTWQALAKWANTRFGLDLKEKDLRKIADSDPEELRSGRDDLEQFLNDQAAESIEKINLAEAREFLEPDWGRRTLAGWVHHKFTLAIDPAIWNGLDRAEIVRRIRAAARELYSQKEAELPLRIALRRYLSDRTQSQTPRYDRDGLAAWASERYQTQIDADELRPMLRSQIETRLIELAQKSYRGAQLSADLESKLAAAVATGSHGEGDPATYKPEELEQLAAWSRDALELSIKSETLESMTPGEIRSTLLNALDARHRPEMRDMEKSVLLQILDSSWMEHLRTMDHLRSSIGLQGYAQIDPKVEYKREGMRIFGEMWNGIGDRVTDLIFRVEQFDPEILDDLGSRWQLDRARPFTSKPSLSSPAHRPPETCAGGKMPRSPRVNDPPKRNASRFATLEKKSAATTSARVDQVKNTKHAACASNPRQTRFSWSPRYSSSHSPGVCGSQGDCRRRFVGAAIVLP